MKSRKIFTFAVFFAFFLIFPFSNAWAVEQIDSFHARYVINKNGTVDVTDTIYYDFGSEQRHGIFRKIITSKKNEDGKTYKVDVSDISVLNQSGQPYRFTTEKTRDYISIKIGDANKFVTGKNIYIVKYRLSGALTYFSDHDELYWNATGFETQVPTKVFNAVIVLPEGAAGSSDLGVECFTGAEGSTQKDCNYSIVNDEVSVSVSGELNPNENLTFAVKYPKGLVQILEPKNISGFQDTLLGKIISSILSIGLIAVLAYWSLILPVLIIVRWYKDRANTQNKQRVVSAWFESPETLDKRQLTPSETGALVDKNVDHKDISATIIDLAQRGYFKISIDDKKNVSFDKLKEFTDDGGLVNFEKDLLGGIFKDGKSVSALRDLELSKSFYDVSEKFKTDVSKRLVSEKLFLDDPQKIQLKYSVLGVVALMTMNVFLAVVAFLLGRKSARRTDLGIEKYSEGVSLKNFLVSQDAQINFQSQNQMFFEKLLPYATAFGVEKVWAKRFEGLQLKQPDWYSGDLTNAAALGVLSSRLNSGIRTNYNTMSPTRSSSGFHSGFSGGHSGGGGGGGGTGSW